MLKIRAKNIETSKVVYQKICQLKTPRLILILSNSKFIKNIKKRMI